MDKKILNEEMGRMKSLFGYERGVVISEQSVTTGFNTYTAPKVTQQQDSGKQKQVIYTVNDIIKDLKSGALGPTNTGAGTSLNDIISGINKIKDGAQFTEVDNVLAKSPILGYSSIIKLLRGEIDGADVNAIQTIKNSLKGKGINLNWNTKTGSGEVDPNSISIQVSSTPNVTKSGNTQKLNFTPERFPLKYMMQGENVKKLQQALDVRNKAGQPNITGKFYTATQAALNKKVKELGLRYDEKVGLYQDSFNKIINPQKPKNQSNDYVSGYATDFDNFGQGNTPT